jgi:hypothetical protein
MMAKGNIKIIGLQHLRTYLNSSHVFFRDQDGSSMDVQMIPPGGQQCEL